MVQAKRLLEAVGKLSVRAASIQREKAHSFHQLFATKRANRGHRVPPNRTSESVGVLGGAVEGRRGMEEGLSSHLAFSITKGVSRWTHMSHLHALQVLSLQHPEPETLPSPNPWLSRRYFFVECT